MDYPTEWFLAYKRMGEKYGTDQLIKLLEEIGELSQVICKYINSQGDPSFLDHFAEEMCDVQHMLNNVEVMLDLRKKKDAWMIKKMVQKIMPKSNA